MAQKEMKAVFVTMDLHTELQIAKQILGQSVPQIITEGVKLRLKPIQGKVDRIRAELEEEN